MVVVGGADAACCVPTVKMVFEAGGAEEARLLPTMEMGDDR